MVGATVLVALGVIFIPMLLERDSDDARLSVRMEIPPQPDIDFIEPASKAPKQETIEPLPSMEEALKDVKSPVPPPPTKSAEPVKPVAVQKPAATASEAPAATTDKTGWIVQVGSFSRQTNAEALKDKLIDGGFKAYVEQVKANTGPIYRVRIGPLTERKQAEAMVKRLHSKGGYRGIVMADDNQ